MVLWSQTSKWTLINVRRGMDWLVWWSSPREQAPGNQALKAELGCFSRRDSKTLLSEYPPAENEPPHISTLLPCDQLQWQEEDLSDLARVMCPRRTSHLANSLPSAGPPDVRRGGSAKDTWHRQPKKNYLLRNCRGNPSVGERLGAPTLRFSDRLYFATIQICTSPITLTACRATTGQSNRLVHSKR